MTGLIIGSITPDLEYFIRMKVISIYSHTWIGMIWFDLPLGLFLTFLYHNLIRNTLIDNLPIPLKQRLYRFKGFSWNNYIRKNFIVVILSLIIGISSHILWDSFTHVSGYFVMLIPALRHSISILGLQLHIYKILQHVSSLIGGGIVLLCIWKIPANNLVPIKKIGKYWGIVFFMLLSLLLIKFILTAHIQLSEMPIISITGIILGTIVASLILRRVI